MDIDFVIPWVDSSDENWKQSKKECLSRVKNVEVIDDSDERYRDFDQLRYLLRSIEKYAPWVRKIFLVTANQRPTWLKEAWGEKLEIVDHKDIIDKENLPTFNSDSISLSICRIKELSEHFVYLNDDYLFTNFVKPTDFFSKDGKIVESVGFMPLQPLNQVDHIFVNNISAINSVFSKRNWIKKNWHILFHPKNGLRLNLYSLILSPLPFFTGFYDHHVGEPMLKSSYFEAKKLWPRVIEETIQSPFRSDEGVSDWLIRYYQYLTKPVKVRNKTFGKHLHSSDISAIEKNLTSKKRKMIVINDFGVTDQNKLTNALEKFYPEKSKFEK